MDPVSHALLGAVSAHALARPPRRTAALAGALGALVPDADVLIQSASDPLLTLEYHRHFTHALPMAPLVALAPALLLWLILRRRSAWRDLYVACLLGVLSASLLDTCTSYGVHLLWPFVEQRHAWSIVAVVDPVMTLVLAVGLGLALKQDVGRRSRLALLAVAAYLALGWVQNERVRIAVLEHAAARGHDVARLEVKPTLGNLILWRSIYRSGERYVVDAVRPGVSAGTQVYPGGIIERVDPVAAAAAVGADSVLGRDIVRFAQQSDGFLVRHPERPDVLGDVRYALLPDSLKPLWGIRVDATRPAAHAEFLTLREFGAAERDHFLALLMGSRRP